MRCGEKSKIEKRWIYNSTRGLDFGWTRAQQIFVKYICKKIFETRHLDLTVTKISFLSVFLLQKLRWNSSIQDLQEQLEFCKTTKKGESGVCLKKNQQKFATAESGISTMEWYHLKVKVLSFSKKITNIL